MCLGMCIDDWRARPDKGSRSLGQEHVSMTGQYRNRVRVPLQVYQARKRRKQFIDRRRRGVRGCGLRWRDAALGHEAGALPLSSAASSLSSSWTRFTVSGSSSPKPRPAARQSNLPRFYARLSICAQTPKISGTWESARHNLRAIPPTPSCLCSSESARSLFLLCLRADNAGGHGPTHPTSAELLPHRGHRASSLCAPTRSGHSLILPFHA